MTVLNVFDVIT